MYVVVWVMMVFVVLGDGVCVWELFGIINLVNYGSGVGDIEVYKVEFYVVVVDVYGVLLY